MRTRNKTYTSYGITKDDKNKILRFCRHANENKQDKMIVKSALSEIASAYTALMLYEALTEGLSYEKLDEKRGLVIGKEDFYGYRRKGMEAIKRYMQLTGRWEDEE